MEDFLDGYFSLVFSKMDLDSIHDRRKQFEIVDYFKTIIDGLCQAGVCDAQLGTHADVATCLGNHGVNKDNGDVCTMGKPHGILHVALKIAYDYRLDNDVVKNLLEAVSLCERNADDLFVVTFFQTKIAALVIGWRSKFISREENVEAMTFILEFATKGKLRYSYNDEILRIVDYPMKCWDCITPLDFALRFEKPDVVTLLLRYGAGVDLDGKGNLPYAQDVLGLSQERNASTLRAPWPANPVHTQWLDAVKSLNVLHCAFPLIKMAVGGIGAEPPDLKTLCRYVVRKTLNENWQLPEGIYLLNVPSSLKDYLDLKEIDSATIQFSTPSIVV